MNTFNYRKYSPDQLFKMQSKVYSDKILLSDEVPAGEAKTGKVNISNLGHFGVEFITVRYETLYDNNGTIEDTGVNYLRGRLVDASNSTTLFSDFIPLDMFSTPGRVKSQKSADVVNDAPGNTLFYPMEQEYLFTRNGDIVFECKNDSNTPLAYEICFHGKRMLED